MSRAGKARHCRRPAGHCVREAHALTSAQFSVDSDASPQLAFSTMVCLSAPLRLNGESSRRLYWLALVTPAGRDRAEDPASHLLGAASSNPGAR